MIALFHSSTQFFSATLLKPPQDSWTLSLFIDRACDLNICVFVLAVTPLWAINEFYKE